MPRKRRGGEDSVFGLSGASGLRDLQSLPRSALPDRSGNPSEDLLCWSEIMVRDTARLLRF